MMTNDANMHGNGGDPGSEADARLVALLRLKRHETPGEAYFENLVDRCRARMESGAGPARNAGFKWEAVRNWFAGGLEGRWLVGGVAAYGCAVAAVLGLLQWSADPGNEVPVTPVSLQPGMDGPVNGIQIPFQFSVQPVRPLGVPVEEATHRPVAPESGGRAAASGGGGR